MIDKYLRNIKSFAVKHAYPGSDYVKQVERGQSAKILVIGCADSLVDPALMLGAEPNEIFTHRNIAAIVPSYTQNNSSPDGTGAVLEYAVNHLEVTDIIVLGHGCCGGMKALLKGFSPRDPNSTFIDPWIQQVKEARDKIEQEGCDINNAKTLTKLEQETVRLSLSHLSQYPWIQKKLNENSLTLHGLHFDRGTLSQFDTSTQKFNIVSQEV